MLETPFSPLLDRDKAKADVNAHFGAQADALTDMVNYGTNLIRRCYGTSKKTTADVVILGVLLKQGVAMLDAIEVLLRAGIVHAAFLESRAALEASIYLEWLASSEAEHKANCYIVATLRHERMWALRATKGSMEARAFDPIIEQLGLDMHQKNPTLGADAQAHLAAVNRTLTSGPLKKIDAEFERIRQQRGRDFDPEWYVPAGATSLRQIAKQLGRLPQYEFYYQKGSHVTHSAIYNDHIRFKSGGQVTFLAVRSLRHVDELLNATMETALSSFVTVLKHYRPDELKAFGHHYLSHWRDAFLSVKKVVEA